MGQIVAVLATLSLSAQERDQRLREDLLFVTTELPRRHPNFFHATPEAEFRRALAGLESAISEIREEAFYTRLAAVVAMGRDAHTSLGILTPAANNVGFRPLPILLRWFDDGVFVTAAAAQFISLNGARLSSIGGRPVEDWIAELRAVIPHENEPWFRSQAPSYLRNLGVLRALGAAPPDGPAVLKFLLASGGEQGVELEASDEPLIRPVQERPGFTQATLRRLSEFYWFESWPRSATLYVAYRVCSEMPLRPFASFAAEVLRALDDGSIRTLVIDLRGNTGGNSAIVQPLVTGLAARVPDLSRRAGFRIYSLIDRGTFSSGMWAAMDLKQPVFTVAHAEGDPLLITAGEPTGGTPGSFGEVLTLTLPHSRISLTYSTRRHSQRPYIPVRDALYPDVVLPLRSTDYYARNDTYITAALARAGYGPVERFGEIVVVNAASSRLDSGMAPGSYVSAFGWFPRPDLVLSLNGARVTPLGITPTQLVFRMPDGVTGEGLLEAAWDGAVQARGSFPIVPVGPGLFVADSSNVFQPGAALNEDSEPNSPQTPAATGSVVQLFGTGQGSPLPGGRSDLSVWIGQERAEVIFSGTAPGHPGLWQINARVPAGLTGEQPVVVSANGLLSNAVTIRVQ